MDKVRKYSIEAVIILAIIYTIFFSSSWSGKGIANKFESFIILFIIFLLSVLIKFAWPQTYNKLYARIFTVISKTRSSSLLNKIIVNSLFGLILMVILSFFELITTYIFSGTPLVVGFPYPLYSFTTNKIILSGILLNLTLYSLLIYFISRIIFESENS